MSFQSEVFCLYVVLSAVWLSPDPSMSLGTVTDPAPEWSQPGNAVAGLTPVGAGRQRLRRRLFVPLIERRMPGDCRRQVPDH
jgi:hypothetical protein